MKAGGTGGTGVPGRLLGLAILLVCAACASAPAQAPVVPQDHQPPVVPPPVTEAQAANNPHTTPPALPPVKALTVPAVIERTLANGLRLLIVEHHELPVIDMQLIIRSGGEADPPARQGVATLVAGLLDEGTTSRNALQIADQLADLGATIGTTSAWDASRVTLHAPTAKLDSALSLMADIALRPSFPANELERLRQERLTSLLQQRDRGPAIAGLAYNHILFGAQHPYGRPLQGNEVTTRAITRNDVQQFYSTYYRPNNATMIIVGSVNPDEITQRIERLFGGWPRGPVPATTFPAPPAAGATTIFMIDKPDAAQSSFRIGTVGVARATADYFPILVMNTILGGAFTSRLNQNLREVKGYTYGAGSNFDMRQAAGPFTALAEIETSKSDSALIEFMKELRDIRKAVPAAELEKAKRYLQLGLPATFETTGDIAARLAPIALYQLPLDYFSTYSQRIAAISAADVQRVALQYVRPDQLNIVIVGDLKVIEAGIRALRIGRVELRDLTGRPIVQ
jgi:predicted Zn-dependent peptidase